TVPFRGLPVHRGPRLPDKGRRWVAVLRVAGRPLPGRFRRGRRHGRIGWRGRGHLGREHVLVRRCLPVLEHPSASSRVLRLTSASRGFPSFVVAAGDLVPVYHVPEGFDGLRLPALVLTGLRTLTGG